MRGGRDEFYSGNTLIFFLRERKITGFSGYFEFFFAREVEKGVEVAKEGGENKEEKQWILGDCLWCFDSMSIHILFRDCCI